MANSKERVVGTGTATVILVGTVICVFGIGTLFSVQYEYNCTSDAATKATTCTERRAWNGSGAIQALSAIAGAGAGGAAAIWRAGGLPKFVERLFGASDDTGAE